VRSAEALYPALRDGRYIEAKRKQDEQVDKAVAAIGRRQSDLAGIRVDALSDGDRARVVAVQARCAALVERLSRCRRTADPPEASEAAAEPRTAPDAGR
jgi:hypothetical protein